MIFSFDLDEGTYSSTQLLRDSQIVEEDNLSVPAYPYYTPDQAGGRAVASVAGFLETSAEIGVFSDQFAAFEILITPRFHDPIQITSGGPTGGTFGALFTPTTVGLDISRGTAKFWVQDTLSNGTTFDSLSVTFDFYSVFDFHETFLIEITSRREDACVFVPGRSRNGIVLIPDRTDCTTTSFTEILRGGRAEDPGGEDIFLPTLRPQDATSATLTPVPLPTSGMLLIAGLGGLVQVRRRRITARKSRRTST